MSGANPTDRPTDRPFQKVLIANRGEIVIRVLRSLREMGIPGVAVYSEPDARAPHVIHSDEAYLLGPAEPAASYLNQDRILEVAKRSGCDAIHPGYGFLSENAGFARRCAAEKITFIGPPPGAIEAMGLKIGARELMEKAGVPVVPGTSGEAAARDDHAALAREAGKMGYPVLIKASAGGGGKGMRIVHDENELEMATRAARGEAEKAFGDGTIYMEKYLERPRHIEFQIFADDHGNCVHLFERDCSIQRRHQKIIEESPAPGLSDELRRQMGEAAVAAARAIDYRGAGTIEFLLDVHGGFYFLEMNTRLQVEHSVTEGVTGLDLVRLQIETAAGRPLDPAALSPTQRGHSIECRIYAEDPSLDFLPMSGEVIRVRHPRGPGVRIDSALRDGFSVPIHYDPMLAKVITIGRGRREAIHRMQLALSEFVILGIPTNLLHLQAVLDTEEFLEGNLTTHFLAEVMPDWKPEDVPLPDEGRAALLLHDLVGGTSGGGSAGSGGSSTVASPWRSLSQWRLNRDAGGSTAGRTS